MPWACAFIAFEFIRTTLNAIVEEKHFSCFMLAVCQRQYELINRKEANCIKISYSEQEAKQFA